MSAAVCLLLRHTGSSAEPKENTNDGGNPRLSSGTNLIASFRVQRGFTVELVAAAPIVVAPVAMAFDENGRLFVVERRDLPGRRDQAPQPGRIRLLEDRDGEGVFNSSAVFADNLSWPSALACYDGGIFVAASSDILYLKDAGGNGLAGARNVIFSGFGGTNPLKPDALLNSFVWGLDNRIHGATAGIGGIVTA
jgi:putative membrane-bound dehydrogenase-like protein